MDYFRRFYIIIDWLDVALSGCANYSQQKKGQEIRSHGMNFSEPGNEQRGLEVTFDHLDK